MVLCILAESQKERTEIEDVKEEVEGVRNIHLGENLFQGQTFLGTE